jgi:hypothetical protein
MTNPGPQIAVGDFLRRVSGVSGEDDNLSDPSYGAYDDWEVTVVTSVDNSDPNFTVEVITVRQKTRP